MTDDLDWHDDVYDVWNPDERDEPVTIPRVTAPDVVTPAAHDE